MPTTLYHCLIRRDGSRQFRCLDEVESICLGRRRLPPPRSFPWSCARARPTEGKQQLLGLRWSLLLEFFFIWVISSRTRTIFLSLYVGGALPPLLFTSQPASFLSLPSCFESVVAFGFGSLDAIEPLEGSFCIFVFGLPLWHNGST